LALGLFLSVFASFFAFREIILNALIFWALPALLLNHIALKLQASLLGFIVAGSIAGLLGLSVIGLVRYLAVSGGPRALANWDRFIDVAPRTAFLLALVGALSSIFAWALMRAAVHMRTTPIK
jgi:hypothetical protein